MFEGKEKHRIRSLPLYNSTTVKLERGELLTEFKGGKMDEGEVCRGGGRAIVLSRIKHIISFIIQPAQTQTHTYKLYLSF